ncbi:hypothetical protein BCV71DRAFT_188509, partial [Rhizopus microsporus]
GGKPAPNYTLFVCIFSLPIPFFLVYFPYMYEHHNKFRKPGKFCMKNRTNLIFCGFNSFLWATAGIATAVHSNDSSNCAVDSSLRKTYGDSYVSAWGTQCNLAKVTTAFVWITCLIWVSTLLCTVIAFWKEKQDIQQRLKEHRMSKQTKLEEDPPAGYTRPAYQEDDHYQHESSPFNDPVQYQQPQYQPHPPYDGHNVGQYQPTNQYHTSPPVQFSPMPTPQHVMPTPEQAHYNAHNF